MVCGHKTSFTIRLPMEFVPLSVCEDYYATIALISKVSRTCNSSAIKDFGVFQKAETLETQILPLLKT